MPVTSLTTVHSQEGGQKWMSTASLVSLMPLCLDNKREKNQGLLPSQLNYTRFYYCNMHTSFTDLCVYHTYTHSLPNSFSVFILSLFIDWFVHMCDVCMCVCARTCAQTHVWHSAPVEVRRQPQHPSSPPTLLHRFFSLLLVAVHNRLTGPWVRGILLSRLPISP